ncbi:MAG: LCP family protein [Clostridia bacterium]|nr:LCP family protein [Clostridia bacterium]
MSKRIIERRKASANVPESNRADIVYTEQKQKRSVIKGILLAIVVLIAIVALVFVVVNALIKNISESMSPKGSYKDTIPTIAESFKENNPMYSDSLLESQKYNKYALLVSNNHSSVVNAIRDEANVFNYAIYGIDNSDPNKASADVIVIASINKDSGKLTYTLIDNTSLVYIPYADVIGQLKDAYNFGTANLLSRTIAQNFGIDIDGYVEMNMEAAAEMVDLVGGIEMAMTQEEVDNLNIAIELYNERFGAEVLKITKKGEKVTLNGVQTLAYLRGKKGIDTNAIFDILVEVTKISIKDGVKGIKALTDKLAENATTSTEADDFSSLLQIAVKTTGDALADSMNTQVFGNEYKNWVWVSDDVSFITYNDLDKAVTDLQVALYGE